VVTLLFMIQDRYGHQRALDTASALMGAEFGWKTLLPKAGSFSRAWYKSMPDSQRTSVAQSRISKSLVMV
jgi:hypothetical protein